MLTAFKQCFAILVARAIVPVLVTMCRRRPRFSFPTLGFLSRYTFLTHCLCDLLAKRGEWSLAQGLARRWIDDLLHHPGHRAPQEIAIPTAPPGEMPEPEDLHRVLVEALALMESGGFEPFICFGLLLGCIRDGDFLPHDSDLDIGLFWAAGDLEKVRALLSSGGFVVVRHEPEPWPCRLKARHPDCPVELDILFFRRSAPHVQTYTRICGHPVIRNRSAFSLKTMMFRGETVQVPDPPENFLSENYGNWREKVPFYDYILSSQLTDFNQPVIRYYFLRTFAMAIYMRHDKARQELRRIGREHYPEEKIS